MINNQITLIYSMKKKELGTPFSYEQIEKFNFVNKIHVNQVR